MDIPDTVLCWSTYPFLRGGRESNKSLYGCSLLLLTRPSAHPSILPFPAKFVERIGASLPSARAAADESLMPTVAKIVGRRPQRWEPSKRRSRGGGGGSALERMLTCRGGSRFLGSAGPPSSRMRRCSKAFPLLRGAARCSCGRCKLGSTCGFATRRRRNSLQ